MFQKLMIYFLFIGLLSSCMMIPVAPVSSPLAGMHTRANVPGITPADLPDANSEAAITYSRYCSQCHKLPSPGMHTANEWQKVVPRMVAKTRGHMTGMMSRTPSAEEQSRILAYLDAHAQQALDTASSTLNLTTGAGKLFQQTCSRCHALPAPTQHTSTEWPVVVARMKNNMQSMGKSIPPDDDMKMIIEFLQANARS